jgi:tetratricopeptide (TPR) repeat protein
MASSARIDELKRKFDENPRRYFAPLANEFRKMGDTDQAILICQEFLPQQPGHMSGHIVYGQALYESGQMMEARAVFETALGLDPENLIALRHLGDIARGHDDIDTALRWYQRVLEADPRNEEIQALIISLAGLDQPAVQPSAPPVDAWAPTPVVSASAIPASSSEDRFGPPVGAAPAPAVAAFSDAAPLDIELDDALPLAAPEYVAESPRAPLEAFALDGFEPTSGHASFEEPRTADRAEGLEPTELPRVEAPLDQAIDLEASFEAGIDSFAIPPLPEAPAPFPILEQTAPSFNEAASLEIDDESVLPPHGDPLIDEVTEPELRETEAIASFELPPEVVAAEAELIDAGQSLEQPASELDLQEVELEQVELEEDLGHQPTAASPFVTETMAELYLKQGFQDQALAVYRQLSDANPDDARLRAKVDELAPAAEVPAAPAGPNVREFFAGFAARRPGERWAASVPPAHDDFASFDAVPEPVPQSLDLRAESFAPEPAAPEPAPARAPMSSAAERGAAAGGAVGGGSIDALFGTRGVGTSEDSAASALAQAFGSAPEELRISGRPTRAASAELSLDSVFRDGGSRPPRSSQSFSFDQFFSESAEQGAGTPRPSQEVSAVGEPAERSADDIEQFNAWLQGLKQK